jgi:hypothetical protein
VAVVLEVRLTELVVAADQDFMAVLAVIMALVMEQEVEVVT